MVPTTFVVLDKFPLTPNGKINRKALPQPESNLAEAKHDFTPPRSPAEESLAKIWRELLGQDVIGIDDNFFESGGHSLLAMQMMARVRGEFHTEISLRNIFEAPTIVELAAILERKQEQPAALALQPLAPAQNISARHAQDLLDRLDELSDSEVESLLKQMLVEPGGKP
jgi:acyl carrier protein